MSTKIPITAYHDARTTYDGTTYDGTAYDGTANDGIANDGATNDESANDGVTNDGWLILTINDDGSTSNASDVLPWNIKSLVCKTRNASRFTLVLEV